MGWIAYKYDSVDNCPKTNRETSDPRQMDRSEQRGRTTPGSEFTLGSCRNQAQGHALRRGHRADCTKLCGYLCPSSCPRDKDKKSHMLMFIDITRAHPHCTKRRQVWVQLPAWQRGRRVRLALAINLRIEGQSSHGQAWFHLRLVDSLRLRASCISLALSASTVTCRH